MSEPIDWFSYPGPAEYRPDTLAPAFAAVRGAVDKASSQQAYRQMLGAIAHDHSGTLYPATEGAVGPLLSISLGTDSWPAAASLEVLTDLLSSFELPDVPVGETSAMLTRMRRQVRSHSPALRVVAAREAPESAAADSLLAVLASAPGTET